MHPTPPRTALRCGVAALLAALAASPLLHSQATRPPNPNSAAKDEDAILLNPFQVSTDQDRGYAAGNTLSGSRADTPLAITPASISVMTKQFLDDFAITDMNEAAAWTINMDPPTGGESGPFGGNRFQTNFRGAGNGPNFPQRNGALQYFVADSYNSERFEFSRGPSTALFGDGGAGGIQGSTSKQARVNNRSGSATLRFDSFGGYRGTFDYNFGVDRWAVRFNALHQNVKSYVDATGNQQNAASIAATYRLTRRTQLRVEFEHSAEWNIMYRKTYNEQASIWNHTRFNEDNTAIASPGNFGLGQISATTDYLVWNFGTSSLLNYRGNQYQSLGLGYPIPWSGRGEIPGFKPGVDKHFFLGPADAYSDRDLNARGFYLEHSFHRDLFAQLAYITSDVDVVQRNLGSIPGDYRIDVNRLLPNGAPNPNVGKAYSDTGGQSLQYQQDGVHEVRGTATWKFTAPKLLSLGQRFNLNGGWRQGIFEIQERSWRWANNPAQADLGNANNVLRYRIYWDSPRPHVGWNLPPPAPGFVFREVRTTPANSARRSRTLRYAQLLSQTTFLEERIGFTGSFRRDNVRLKAREGISFDANYEPIMGNAGVVGDTGWRNVWQNSQSAGVVAYAFPNSLRYLRPLGLVANYSSNFEQISRSTLPLYDGRTPPLTYAKTKDVGLRYSVPNGVAYGTLLYYQTDNKNILSAFGSTGDFRNIFTNLGYTDPNLIGPSAFTTLQDIASRKLSGWEVEFTANPTRSLTLTANYGHPIVETVSDSEGRRAFYAAHLDEFKAGAAARQGQVVNGKTIVDPAVIATAMQNIENSFNGFTPGTLSNGSARHRINVAGSYRFNEGAWRGFAVNAGVNYRGFTKIGSRDPQIKFGTTAPTVRQTADAAYDYLWTSPSFAATVGANYTRRFGKITARFQVNVTNLLDDDKPQYTGYSVINANQLLNGNPRTQLRSGFNVVDPRKIICTSTFTF